MKSMNNRARKPFRIAWMPLGLMMGMLIGVQLHLHAQPNQVDAQNRKQGEWIKRHQETGEIAYKAFFKNDVPVGTTERYYEDGSLQALIHHGRQGRDRVQAFYPEGGGLMAMGNYLNQERDSVWLFFSEDSVLTAEETYQKGQKQGVARTYYPDGSISEKTTWKDGVKHGPWEQFYPDGTLKMKATVEEGIRYEGAYESYYANGKPLMKGKYVDGQKESSWYHHHEDGSVEIIYVYRSGKIESEHRQNGVFEDYFPDDIKRSSYTYKDGKKHGPFKEFYHQGEWRTEEATDEFGESRQVQRLYGTQVKREGKYLHGELHGEVVQYNTKGKVTARERYDKGERVK